MIDQVDLRTLAFSQNLLIDELGDLLVIDCVYYPGVLECIDSYLMKNRS